MKQSGGFDRAGAKAAGYTDAEIDAYLAQESAAPAAKTPAAPAAPAAPKAAEGWSTRGKALSVAREALGQGAGFGFGDEVEAAITSLLPGRKSYGEELQRIRGEMGEYAQAYPTAAMGAQLAGGLASGYGLARGALAGAKGASSVARALTKSAALQGALGGAGASDEGPTNRLVGAGTGAVIGGALGKVGGAVAGKGAQMLARGAAKESAGVAAIREALEAQRMEPSALRQKATEMAAAAPEARAMDVLGEPGVRIARRIQAIGGEAGQDIGSAMTARAEARPERLQQALTRTTGKGQENLLETVDEIAKRRKEVADPLYETFYQQGAKESSGIDDVLRTPFGKSVVDRARRNAANERRPFIEPAQPAQMSQLFDAQGNVVPITLKGAEPAKYHPQTIDDIKKAMDDIIYESRFANVQSGQGGILPGEKRVASALRHEFVTAADAAFPDYAKARSAWAGEKALIDAIEIGQDFAKKNQTANKIAEELTNLSNSEKEFVQRGWLDAQRELISNNALRPSELKKPQYREKVQVLFGNQADNILSALDAEMQLGANASAIMGGSRTAPLQADIAQELGPTKVGKFVRAIASPRATAVNALEAGLTRAGERIGGERAAVKRVQKAGALLTPAERMGDLLTNVEREYAARAKGTQFGTRVGSFLGGLTGRESVRRFRGEI
jgi:hypothetical protein